MPELQHEDSPAKHEHFVVEGTEHKNARLCYVSAGVVHVLFVFVAR